MAGHYTCLLTHFVWGTKDRNLWLTAPVTDRLYPYFGGIAESRKSLLLQAGGMADHVHLLVSVHPTVSVSDLAATLKANSSRWIREDLGMLGQFAWQEGYGAFTVSRSRQETVTEYIANQVAHHQERSFEEEFKAMLARHEVPYEERYLWA